MGMVANHQIRHQIRLSSAPWAPPGVGQIPDDVTAALADVTSAAAEWLWAASVLCLPLCVIDAGYTNPVSCL